MLTSMTGFGRSASGTGNSAVQIVVRAYNARFMEMKIRGLNLSPELEAELRKQVIETLKRGTVYITIERGSENGKGEITLNRQRFEAIKTVLEEIQKEYGRSLDLGNIITKDDLFITREEQEVDEQLFKAVLAGALAEVKQMRAKEGAALYKDTVTKLDKLSDLVNTISGFTTQLLKEQTAKLKERISVLTDKMNVDENRLAQETALLVDRSDISEELVRINSHINQYKKFIELDEPVGKRLAFLLQEMGREINTIGSKNGSGAIVNIVIEFKHQLEQLREQVQNIL